MLILGSQLQPEAPSSFLSFTLSNELGRLCLVFSEWVSQMVSAVSFLFVSCERFRKSDSGLTD